MPCNSDGETGNAYRNFRVILDSSSIQYFYYSFQIIWVNYATFLSVELGGTLFLFFNILLHLNQPLTFRGLFLLFLPSFSSYGMYCSLYMSKLLWCLSILEKLFTVCHILIFSLLLFTTICTLLNSSVLLTLDLTAWNSLPASHSTCWFTTLWYSGQSMFSALSCTAYYMPCRYGFRFLDFSDSDVKVEANWVSEISWRRKYGAFGFYVCTCWEVTHLPFCTQFTHYFNLVHSS